MKYFSPLLLAFLLSGLASCTRPWPNMPPITYSGKVIHQELRSGIANATITASRPSVRSWWPMVSPETLATTKSDSNGNFSMTTKSGYATSIVVNTADKRMWCCIDPGTKSCRNLNLFAEANLEGVCYRRVADVFVDPNSEPSRRADAAVRHLVKYFSAHPKEPLKSLQQYVKDGVLSKADFEVFQSAPAFYFGQNSLVEYQWGNESLFIKNASTPIRLVAQRQF
jgi:hypothetical protein